jgi:hypothetical protein
MLVDAIRNAVIPCRWTRFDCVLPGFRTVVRITKHFTVVPEKVILANLGPNGSPVSLDQQYVPHGNCWIQKPPTARTTRLLLMLKRLILKLGKLSTLLSTLILSHFPSLAENRNRTKQ